MPDGVVPATIADFLSRRAHDPRPALRAGELELSWADMVAAGAERAALFAELRRPGPPHIAILLENVPEFLFWIGAASLAGAAIVGINPTRRGDELGQDIRHTDCQLLVTDRAGLSLLADVDVGLEDDRVLVVDDPVYGRLVSKYAGAPIPTPVPSPADLLLLLFTSGTTAAPKAVRCTQGRLARIATRVVDQYGFVPDDVCYCIMPLFHGNALMALWSGALAVGACVALPASGKFSASRFLDEVRTYRATYFTYVGKALTYILATPAMPDDADNPLVRGFGNEASDVDIEHFQRRFGCRIIEAYGSSEGGAAIARVADMPPGSLGLGAPSILIADAATGRECPPAKFEHGRLVNSDEAIGEIVNTEGLVGFEGYYNNDAADAERARDGWYWTGDLGYRDERGFVYFAGRGADWLRVDGENFAAAPVERVLERFAGVAMVAVFAVPDGRSGDAVMAALVMGPGVAFSPTAFAGFLATQPDLGTKWAPRFVRIAASLPLTATSKVSKLRLRDEAWLGSDPVWWRPDPRAMEFGILTTEDEQTIRSEFIVHGRADLLPVDDLGSALLRTCRACGEVADTVVCSACGRVASEGGAEGALEPGADDSLTTEADADFVDYDFDETSIGERTEATDLLVGAGVPYRWDSGFRLVVPIEREAEVDVLFGHVDEPESVQSLAILRRSAEALAGDPSDEDAAIELADATGVVTMAEVPDGINRILWSTICYLARQLMNVLTESTDAETPGDPADVVAAADALRAVLS